eukprot:g33927.t1
MFVCLFVFTEVRKERRKIEDEDFPRKLGQIPNTFKSIATKVAGSQTKKSFTTFLGCHLLRPQVAPKQLFISDRADYIQCLFSESLNSSPVSEWLFVQ